MKDIIILENNLPHDKANYMNGILVYKLGNLYGIVITITFDRAQKFKIQNLYSGNESLYPSLHELIEAESGRGFKFKQL